MTTSVLIEDRVKWWEPWRATRREAWEELRSVGLFKPGPWVRPVIVAAVVIAPMLAWMLTSFPGVSIPWMRLILYLLLGGPAVLMFGIASAVLPPRSIEVSRQWIQISDIRGRIDRDRIEAIALEHDDGEGARLNLKYRTRRRDGIRTRSIVVSPKVDLRSLSALVEQLASEPAAHRGASATDVILTENQIDRRPC